MSVWKRGRPRAVDARVGSIQWTSADGGGPPGPRARLALWLSVALTGALYLLPYGHHVAYPLVLFSTLAHELGHGLAAWAVGAEFQSLRLYADASGVAQLAGAASRTDRALITLGGLLGPAALGAVLFVAGAHPRFARVALVAGGAALAILGMLVVRNLFGGLFVATLAGVLVLVGLRASAAASQFTIVFLATQLALSVFSRGDYLFTESAHTGAGTLPSDVAQLAEVAGLTYWLWGVLVGGISIVILLAGLWSFHRQTRRA